MPLHLVKWERREGAERDAFGNAALAVCRHARSIDGVRSARFYWANADTIGLVVDAEPGAWGPNSGNGPTPDAAKNMFHLSDLSRQVSSEFWVEAGQGEQTYRMSR